MNRISKELIKIAREIKALDEEGDGSGFQMWHDHENTEQERLDLAQKQGKKYILHHKERGLWRIQACKTIPGARSVRKGEFGGFVESEQSLSHEGKCWIYDGAKVYEGGRVEDDAVVWGKAQVVNGAIVAGRANIGDRSLITTQSKVEGRASILGHSMVSGNGTYVCSNAYVSNAWIVKGAKVGHDAIIVGQGYGNITLVIDYDVEDQEIVE